MDTRQANRNGALAFAMALISTPGICSSSDVTPTSSEAPIVNAHPTKIVRVVGTADRSLSMSVRTQYLSSAPVCRRSLNSLEGVSSPISVWVETPVQRSGDEYEARVALDHFLEGKCNWYPFVIGFYFANADGIATGRFETSGQATRHVNEAAPMVWIHSRGKGDPMVVDVRSNGATALPPFNVGCRKALQGGAAGLLCDELTPSLNAEISEQATEVHIAFRDLTAHAVN